MDIRKEILKEHSKAQTQKIVTWIGTDKKRLQELVSEYRIVQRSAWAIGIIGQQYPEMIAPYLPAMIKRMNEPGVHVAVKRNVVRALQYLDIPGDLQGEVMDTCSIYWQTRKKQLQSVAFL